MAAATERMVTAARPPPSASATPARAISARLCSGAGPRAERSGRSQMLDGRTSAARSVFFTVLAVIANTVLSRLPWTKQRTLIAV